MNASHNLMTTTGKDFHGLPVLCTADLSNNEIASMGVELVSNTRCSNHGVVAKLEILLQGKAEYFIFSLSYGKSIKMFNFCYRKSSFV